MSFLSVLILSFSPIASDPRVRRQVELLFRDCEVTVVGLGGYAEEGVEFLPVKHVPSRFFQRFFAALLLKCRSYRRYYWSRPVVAEARGTLNGRRFDLILANDPEAWPLALDLAKTHDTPVICDAHEYSPREVEDNFWWRFFFQGYKIFLCRDCLPHAASVVTVCDGIADKYAHEFQIERPTVIRNLAPFHDYIPVATRDGSIRLVHHGATLPSRNLEVMIDLMKYLDERFTLDFMLVGGDTEYRRALELRAAGNPRIRFREPAHPGEIVAATRDYDMGLFLLPPVNFNYRHALPNKFFEFIQARLAIAIGPSPEMAKIVKEHDLGVVADDFSPEALAKVLNATTASDIDRYKAAADRAASILSWETERDALCGEINRVLSL